MRRMKIAGEWVTPDQALNVSTVWACLDILSKTVAKCPWLIYSVEPGTRVRTLMDNDPRAWLLNKRPNPNMTAMAFRESLMLQALSWGNAYAEIQPDRAGRPVGLWPLWVDRMTPKLNPETDELFYEYINGDGSRSILPQERVFHLRGLSINGLMGENVTARAVKTIALAIAQQSYSTNYFGRGATLAGVLEYGQTIGPEQHDQLRKEWDENHAGGANSFRPLILEAGMKFTSISANPKDSSLIEDKEFSVEEICRWYNVPPHKVQHLKRATFGNIEHSSIEFVNDSIEPWCERHEHLRGCRPQRCARNRRG